MRIGQRVEVNVATRGGCAWFPGVVIGVRESTNEDFARVDVRGDDGRRFLNCALDSVRTVVSEAA